MHENTCAVALSGAVSPSALAAGFAGGALVVAGDGSIVADNGQVEGLTSSPGTVVPEINALAGRARESGAIASETIVVATGAGDVALEICAVPGFADGGVLVLARDQTAERNLRAALIESRQRYKDLVDSSSDFAWEVDADGRFAFVSPRGALGYWADDLVGQPPEAFVQGSEDYAPLPFLTDRPMEGVEMWMRTSGDGSACVIANCLPLIGGDGVWRGARGVCRDITYDRNREALIARTRHREQLLNYIVGTVRNEVDPADMLTAAAESTSRSMGARSSGIFRRIGEGAFTVAATYGPPLDGYIDHLHGAAGAILIDINGRPILAAATHYRQQVNGAVVLWREAGGSAWSEDDRMLLADVADQLGIANEQITNHERILDLSRTDALTGLLNRRAFFEDELPRRISRLRRDGEHSALLYIDLDNLKRVNDLQGHQRGDEAIVLLRDLLVEHTRPGDAAARLGGDEFAVWFDQIAGPVAEERVRDLMAASVRLRQFSGDGDHPMGLSIGVAFFDSSSSESIDELVARADAAMYSIKNAGKGGYRIAPSASAEAGGKIA